MLLLIVVETATLIFVVVLLSSCKSTNPVADTSQQLVMQYQNIFNGKGFDMFDHVLYINLDKRPDRRWEVETELRKMGVRADRMTRVPGVIDRFGSLGCSSAHLNALNIFEDHPEWENVLIVEDDAMFAQSRESIGNTLNRFALLHADWDVLQLLANVQEFSDTEFPFIVRILESQTTAGYAVNRKYLPILKKNVSDGIEKLAKCASSNADFCIDQYWKTLQKSGNWFGFHPVIGYQRDGFSDIEQRQTNYTDKNSLRTSYVPIRYVVAVKTHCANLRKNQQQLETLAALGSQGITYFHYWGNEYLESEYEFDLSTQTLQVRSKDDYLNLCDKFGKMIRFLRNYLDIQTNIQGVFFTDDDIVINSDTFVKFLDDNAHQDFWGKKVYLSQSVTMHIADKCKVNKQLANLVDKSYPAIRNFGFEVPVGLEYCPGGGFYLSRTTVPKLLMREDLFLPFPIPHQLEFHLQDGTFRNVCVIDDVNVAAALASSNVFPEDVDISQIVDWEGLTS